MSPFMFTINIDPMIKTKQCRKSQLIETQFQQKITAMTQFWKSFCLQISLLLVQDFDPPTLFSALN